MVTKKDDAVHNVRGQIKAQADEIEKIVEREIARGSLRVVLSGSTLPIKSLTVLQEVAKRYRLAGWSARAENDQRDGMYLVIE